MASVPSPDRGRALPGLGGLVREHREAAGLSLRALAARLGVSASLLSRIENEMAQPSVTTLYGLTAELGLSLDVLTGVGADRDHDAGPAVRSAVVRRRDRPLLRAGPGVLMEVISDPADPALELLSITYEPGASSSEDDSLVTHAGHETGLVLAGELEVTLRGRTHRLRAGDSITFDSSTPHRFRNAGDEPVLAVWMNVGRNTGEAGRVAGSPKPSAAHHPRRAARSGQ